jgi:PleD family two-component response regulator
MGNSNVSQPAKDSEALLGLADNALYEAKHAGRNQIQVATEASSLITQS